MSISCYMQIIVKFGKLIRSKFVSLSLIIEMVMGLPILKPHVNSLSYKMNTHDDTKKLQNVM